jgi:NADH dehydrogenase FAD-containing subunit
MPCERGEKNVTIILGGRFGAVLLKQMLSDRKQVEIIVRMVRHNTRFAHKLPATPDGQAKEIPMCERLSDLGV